ncbi:MAG: MBL fold metallo-hydrolase [Lachnospiraceae bacterium]|nr:MBL fold metallo-hydrolase [Lachnospiraceae bacterium]
MEKLGENVWQITDHIYRIEVPLIGNPLRAINSYLIKGEGTELLIDTGFRRKSCREPLLKGLELLGSRREIRDVFCTHVHSDHSGLAREMAGENRRIYMHGLDLKLQREILNDVNKGKMRHRFLKEGFPRDLLFWIQDNNPARKGALDKVDSRFTAVSDGDVFQIGGLKLQVVYTPGHSPGCCMLWEKEQGIMFTGDTVLFDITPNITAFADVEDALSNYLDSLHAIRNYPVKLALPGHRETGDYQARIDALLRHHDKRLQEAKRIIAEQEGLCAYEITGQMTWKIRSRSWEDFPDTQRWYAVGECLSHLDHLLKMGEIERYEKDGIRRYRVR